MGNNQRPRKNIVMKEKIKSLALEVGGSHYPDVGGALLQKFADRMIEECISAIKNTPTYHARTSYDLNLVEFTIEKTIESVKKQFNLL